MVPYALALLQSNPWGLYICGRFPNTPEASPSTVLFKPVEISQAGDPTALHELLASYARLLSLLARSSANSLSSRPMFARKHGMFARTIPVRSQRPGNGMGA